MNSLQSSSPALLAISQCYLVCCSGVLLLCGVESSVNRGTAAAATAAAANKLTACGGSPVTWALRRCAAVFPFQDSFFEPHELFSLVIRARNLLEGDKLHCTPPSELHDRPRTTREPLEVKAAEE